MLNNDLIIPSLITEDLAYLCGIFAGDGSINYRSNKSEYSLKCVGNPKDEKELYHNVINPKFINIFGKSLKLRLLDSKTTYGFIIYSKQLYNYLTQIIGLPSGVKYSKLSIPDILLKDKKLILAFIRGVFDTDGCISFKKRYKNVPYYPTISLSSKSSKLIGQISGFLKELGFRVVEMYDYKVKDQRTKDGFTIISRIDLNGQYNLRLWMTTITFYSPKHLAKIKNYWKE